MVFQFLGLQKLRCLWTEISIVQKHQHHLLMERKSTRIIPSLVRNAAVLALIIAFVKKIQAFIIFIFEDMSAWH